MDPIPTWLLKQIVDVLLPLILRIVNSSVTSGLFPNALKAAHITPLIKEPTLNAEELKNYRPVSNRPFIGKTIERVVHNQLMEHLSAHGLLEPLQSAYRKSHSTETVVLKVSRDIRGYLDSGFSVELYFY